MTPDQLEQIKKVVADGIETNVNGKIRAISKTLNDYIDEDTKYKIKEDLWREKADPVIDMGTNVQGFAKVVLYILAGLGAVIGVLLGVIRCIKVFFR